MKHLSLLILLITFSFCGSNKNDYSENTFQNNQLYKVTKVVDGDTFWVDNGTAKGIKIRFIGIDAPESQKRWKKEEGHFGKESKAYLTNVLMGQKVRLETDIDSLDRYGRTLAYVYLEDDTFVNAELVKEGYAVIMTVPPNVRYADFLYDLQVKAREKKLGLWNK
ncbi:thermonuclease family protein [Flavobacterium sp. xlx-214]|uniref:thermonuclease family protein n=1 Tax=unclassified Flavobacterium TaxID=196869 RepID=UPI0013D7A3F7|nr:MULTISPECIES: thermonuclease family protein [unclassified Flavobacterium]MBA5792764.1 thermonuclease family protein [Flavobacterium sp. xlx-221]QMI83901.1 thermonuclease family protein [Flavobacterium sp. xlx-214]